MTMEPRLPTQVETERLLLRMWEPTDAATLGEVIQQNIEYLVPWMPWAKFEPTSTIDRMALIAEWTDDWRSGGSCVYGVFLRQDDGSLTAIGGTGLHRRIGTNGLEIGYWIDHAHWGSGLATELSAALTTVAFAQPGVDRVEIHHDKANVRSSVIPERLGFAVIGEETREVIAQAEIGITVVWRMLEADWPANEPEAQQPAP